MDVARYAFRTEWLDVAAALRRQFILLYYKRRDGKDELELVSLGAVNRFATTGCDARFRFWLLPMPFPCWLAGVLQYDVKNKRTFLRRTKMPDLPLEDLLLGAKVSV
jgi:hypothetical protein